MEPLQSSHEMSRSSSSLNLLLLVFGTWALLQPPPSGFAMVVVVFPWLMYILTLFCDWYILHFGTMFDVPMKTIVSYLTLRWYQLKIILMYTFSNFLSLYTAQDSAFHANYYWSPVVMYQESLHSTWLICRASTTWSECDISWHCFSFYYIKIVGA